MRQRKIKARKHGDSNRPHLKFVMNYREAGKRKRTFFETKEQAASRPKRRMSTRPDEGRHAGRDRLRMHLEPNFIPVPSADAWQISNLPIASMRGVIDASARCRFDDAGGRGTLRAKSLKLTATFGLCSTAFHPNFSR
jgi:hypothetical protein